MTHHAAEDTRRLAEILHALEDMAAGQLDRLASVSSAHDEIDAIAYTVNVLVGELRLTVDRLARAEQQSKQASQQKSLFLRNVSHELRTPLSAMLSYTHLLAATPLGEKQYEAVERIRTNGDALRHLIEDLFDLTRIEAGRLQLTLESVSPSEVASDVVQSLLLQAKAKGLKLILSISPDVPHQIMTDARRLRQILMNLVGNAVKFTDAGEVVVSVHATVRRLVVEVSDTGIGVTDADRPRLFSTFEQVDGLRGGLGLGLVLARELSRQLGGDLELVATRPMQGSRFRLSLDIGRSTDRTSSGKLTTGAADLGGLSVLFAEDNADILESYSLLLESVGCRVERAANGLEAVNHAAAECFDVILMDMQMPVLSGLEATRRLRANGFRGPVIALSAHAMIEDRQQFLEAGCDDHIAKPIDFDQLVVRLTEYRSQR